MKQIYLCFLLLLPILGFSQSESECQLTYAGNNFENAEFGLDQKLVANDFDIQAGNVMNIERFIPTIVNKIIDADISIFEDNNGIPGAVIASFSNVVPDSQTQVSSNFNLPWYETEFTLPNSVELDGGENGAKYWIGLIVRKESGTANFWEINTNGNTEPLYYTLDNGTTWIRSPSDFHGVFEIFGSCEVPEPTYSEPCELNHPGNNFENAEFGLDQKLVANDFDIQAGDFMSIERFIPTIVNKIIDADISIFEDNNGIPGAVIASFSNVVPDSQTQVSSNFNLPWYETEFTLPNSVELDGGENGAKYWIGLIVRKESGTANFWEINTNGNTEPLYYTLDNGTTWTRSPSDFHGVFKILGECSGEFVTPDSYCAVEVSSEVRPISIVTFSDLDFSSSPNTDAAAHEYFLDEVAVVNQGTEYEITVKGNTNGNNTQYITVFIDWNQNDVLNDEGEVYQIGTISNSTGQDDIEATGIIYVPAIIGEGETRMRVISSDEGYLTDSCEAIENGQAEDYTVIVNEFTDDYCIIDVVITTQPITRVSFSDIDNLSSSNTNTPAHEYFLNKVGSVERGNSYEMIVEGNTNSPNTHYITAFIDWNQNGILDDEGEIYEVGTITNSTGSDGVQALKQIIVPFDANIGDTRMRIVKWHLGYLEEACDNLAFGQAEDYTLEISGFQDEYCDVEITQEVEPITSFQFAGINNTSSSSTDSEEHEIFIDQIGNVEQGLSYSVKLKGNTNGNNTNYITIFVDWNQDGILDDEGEVYELGSISNSDGLDDVELIGSILVPEGATLGEARLRIIKSAEASPIDPCGTYSKGQAEDYTINVFDYCETNAFNVIPMTKLEFAGIENESSAETNAPAYESFLDITGYVQTGENYSFVAEGNTRGAWDGCFTVFIDWNQNGILDDEGEVYEMGCIFGSNGQDGQQATGSILVPEGATLGTTRLRVLFHEQYNFTEPCGLYGYAQVEDYRLIVSNQPFQECEIQCPDDILIEIPQGQASVVVDYEINYECASSEEIELVMVEGLAPGEEFPLGETQVTYQIVYESQVLDTCSFTVTIEEKMGLSGVNLAKLNYYPNPVKNKLHISYERPIDEISIFDLSGKKVLENEIGTNSFQIDLSELSSGIYIVKIVSEGITESFKVIKL